MPNPATARSPQRRQALRSAWIRLAGLGTVAVLSLSLMTWLILNGWLDEGRLAAFLAPMGWMVVPAYILGYAISTMLWVPGAMMMVIAVSIFGSPFVVIPLSLTGFVLGGSGSYFLSRWLGRDALKRVLEGGGRMLRMTESFQRQAFMNILLLRLVGTPNNVASYMSGLSGVRWRTFAGATLVGVSPGITAGTLLGGSFLKVLHAGTWSVLLEPDALWSLGAVALVATLLVVVRRRQRMMVAADVAVE